MRRYKDRIIIHGDELPADWPYPREPEWEEGAAKGVDLQRAEIERLQTENARMRKVIENIAGCFTLQGPLQHRVPDDVLYAFIRDAREALKERDHK